MGTPFQAVGTIAFSGAIDETVTAIAAGSEIFVSIRLSVSVTTSESVTVSHNGAVIMSELFSGQDFTYRATDVLMVEDDTIRVEWANTDALSGSLEVRLGA